MWNRCPCQAWLSLVYLCWQNIAHQSIYSNLYSQIYLPEKLGHLNSLPSLSKTLKSVDIPKNCRISWVTNSIDLDQKHVLWSNLSIHCLLRLVCPNNSDKYCNEVSLPIYKKMKNCSYSQPRTGKILPQIFKEAPPCKILKSLQPFSIHLYPH